MTLKLNKQTVATIKYRWDTADARNCGWYAEALSADGEFLDDSQKVWFPVEVDRFDADEESELVSALKAEFPRAHIVR